MQRRTFLIWFGRAIYAACAAVVAVPVSRFLTAPSNGPSAGPLRRRLVRLDDLPVGEPQLLPVRGVRQDAWTRHAEEVVGRVWVSRTSSATTAGETALTVFNASCPHSGCTIDSAEKTPAEYVCHCHHARFRTDGTRVPDGGGYRNASPRDMDPLRYELVRDDATGDWWVEIEYREFEVGLADRVERA